MTRNGLILLLRCFATFPPYESKNFNSKDSVSIELTKVVFPQCTKSAFTCLKLTIETPEQGV